MVAVRLDSQSGARHCVDQRHTGEAGPIAGTGLEESPQPEEKANMQMDSK